MKVEGKGEVWRMSKKSGSESEGWNRGGTREEEMEMKERKREEQRHETE